MVRHQLPLHGAGTRRRIRQFTPRLAQADRGISRKPRRWAIRPAPCWSARSPSSSSARARTPASIRCRCSTGCCRSISRCCANWPPAAPNGCRSTSPAWCSTSTIVGAAGAASRLCGNRQGGAAAQDHAGDLFRRARRQSRHRAGAAGRRPASRSGPRAGADSTRPRRRSEGPRAVARRHRRPQRLARRSEPRFSTGSSPWSPSAARTACRSRPPARCCMCRSISALETGARSRSEELAGLLGAEDRGTGHARHGARRRPRSGRGRSAGLGRGRRRRARPRRGFTMRRWRHASPASMTPCAAAPAPFAERAGVQHERFNLPAFPTTTIGSFPQTAEVRKARAAHAKGALTRRSLRDCSCRTRPRAAVRWQEDIGLDVLVHGEFERNDMVQYFGEQLAGFAFTTHGWVQILRLALRPPADPVRRRLAPEADDGRVVAIRPVADEEADEGDADRPRHHPELVVRARRHSAQRGLPADRARDPRRGRRSRGGRRRHDPDRRGGAARGPAAAQVGMAGLSRLGRRGASGSARPACATRPRSTPTCATRSSTTSSTRSARWTPT